MRYNITEFLGSQRRPTGAPLVIHVFYSCASTLTLINTIRPRPKSRQVYRQSK